eukprot:CCRYP_001758-RA/>CCRYP_001758-RA protein AED:0.30 eAED:0.11 QI:0/0/0/1/0/0/2/0/213
MSKTSISSWAWSSIIEIFWPDAAKCLPHSPLLVGECGYTNVTRANKTKKRPWYWDTENQKAFDDVTLAYPNYSREFEIYTDALSKQLGSETTYGTREIQRDQLELLAIVETLKEFKGMLWGQRLKVYTDHKNLIQDTPGLTSDHVYQWRLLLEEFGPEIVYIKDTHSTVANAISRSDIGPVPSEHENWMMLTKCWYHYTMKRVQLTPLHTKRK